MRTNYKIVTKGRIISQEGETSPQIDVLVLKNSYPKKLLNKNLYLAAGVAAAFECKTTLKASHIEDAVKTCAKLKSFYPVRTGTPYKELHSPIIYGLLAHSHSWKGNASTPEINIQQKLIDSDAKHVPYPRMQLDLLCVSDLGTWTSSAITFFIHGANGSAKSTYVGHTYRHEQQIKQFTPIGVLVSYLSQKLAWESPELRDLSDYYRITNIAGSGGGFMREWSTSIYSNGVRSSIEAGMLSNGKPWDEWSISFRY